ncbi:DUF2808 domain-containing protein [Prochlorococcus marinus]|uniref:DUF2808 domain-containing protein n=1 Tax=Prochlorococcus marinus (strain MIT 9211) TaxID=93059 RepID=A9BBI8_PROM4|nr:DUF2808 domain-containing protein [Prochlorococcus marinus]ABX09200.1 conserved hypothetical protein [Prochlorococcus marinus str. MIT 9211]
MIHLKKHIQKLFKGVIISSLMISAFLGLEEVTKKASLAGPGMIEFQWDPDPNFKKLRSYQSSDERLDRAIYYFFLRSSERKTGILKLSIKIPDYFEAKIKPEKLSLCQAKIGGWQEKTRCVKEIPADFEVSENQTSVEVYPAQPIPVDSKTYAVVMKVWNPRKSGMFQFHAYAQSPGAMPISSYVGTWTFDVD